MNKKSKSIMLLISSYFYSLFVIFVLNDSCNLLLFFKKAMF